MVRGGDGLLANSLTACAEPALLFEAVRDLRTALRAFIEASGRVRDADAACRQAGETAAQSDEDFASDGASPETRARVDRIFGNYSAGMLATEGAAACALTGLATQVLTQKNAAVSSQRELISNARSDASSLRAESAGVGIEPGITQIVY